MGWPPRGPEDSALLRQLNVAGLTFGVDNNFLGGRFAAETDLRRLPDSGWLVRFWLLTYPSGNEGRACALSAVECGSRRPSTPT